MVENATSLRMAMRRLWADHVTWTRSYVTAATAGTPVSERLTPLAGGVVARIGTAVGGVISLLGDGDAAAVRLLKNQEDLGGAIIPFYGEAAGSALTDLLKEHILIAVELIAAAKNKDDKKFKEEDARWTENAEKIADLLSGANPNWPKRDVVDLLGQHLSLTKQEVTARLQHNWAADVDAYDQILTEILTVADVLVDGIIKQFPQRVSSGTVNGAPWSLRAALRRLWADHVMWTRSYVVAALIDAPDAEAAAGRLMKNQEDIGGAIVPFYGDEAGKSLTDLLKQHITIAVALIDAVKTGDKQKVAAEDAKWTQNAGAIAELLSGANPHWPRKDVVDLLGQHLTLTKQEVTARHEHRWEADVEAFDQILTEILTVADVLSDGIAKQFPERFGGRR